MAKHYLRVEAVNISNFVYDTQDLSTIRGGGLLLLDAIERVRAEVQTPALTPITTGASSGFFEFDAADLQEATDVRGKVVSFLTSDESLKHATFVVDVLAAGGEEQFGADRERLLALNRWGQMQSPMVAIPRRNKDGGVGVCRVDRVRPATDTTLGPGAVKMAVSESVRVRREYGQEQKQTFYNRQTGVQQTREFSHDLDELTSDEKKGNLNHKMAVIYLDGNRFGQLQAGLCRTASKQNKFDQELKEYRRTFLRSLLGLMGDDQNWLSTRGRYRLETLLWGGDEMLFVVPAWKGWRTLEFFFEFSKDWKFDGHPLHHAGGVVFCHHNAPIHRITNLAHDLAELGKSKSREENLFTYEVLESFDHIGRDLEKFCQERTVQPLLPTETLDARSLIINGGGMKGAVAGMEMVREKLPRRKLHALANNLLTKAEAAPEAISEFLIERQRKPRWRIKSQSGPNCQGFLGSVDDYLRWRACTWLHLSTLWDYLV